MQGVQLAKAMGFCPTALGTGSAKRDMLLKMEAEAFFVDLNV